MKLRIDNTEFGNIAYKRDMKYDFNKPKAEIGEIYLGFKQFLKNPGCEVEMMTILVWYLRERYKPKCKKAKKCTTFKEKVKASIEKKNTWKDFSDSLRRLTNEEYNTFLSEIDDLRMKRNKRVFYEDEFLLSDYLVCRSN